MKRVWYALSCAVLTATFVPIPQNTYAVSNGQVYSWQASTPLPVVREQFGAIAYNGYIYSVGGDDGTTISGTTKVYYAPILTDGSIGTWILDADSPLIVGRHRHSLAIAKDRLYVIGGNAAGNAQASVFVADINSDGSLGTFRSTINLPAGRRRHTSWVVNDYIFVAGGSNPGFDTVYSGHVADNGSVESWTLNANLMPGKRFYHASTLINDYAYVIGGYNELSTPTNTVFYAKVNTDGSTDPWQTNAYALPTPIQGASAFSANGYLYVAGGATSSGIPQNLIYYAKVNDNGSIGQWQTTANALPANKLYHAMTTYNGTAYMLGGDSGSLAGGVTSDTYTLDLSIPPNWSSSILPRAAKGHIYSGSVAAQDGITPLSYTLKTGSLPAGMSLDSSSGQLQGTPQASGTTAFTIEATDAHGYTISQDFELIVDPESVTITPPASPLANITIKTVGGECRGVNSPEVIDAPSQGDLFPAGTVALGGFSYAVSCPSAGKSSTIMVAIDTITADYSRIRIYKGAGNNVSDITNRVTPSWKQLASSARLEFTLTATDGGSFDDDGNPDGTISDPLYIVVTPNTSLASTGTSYTEPLIVGAILIACSALLRICNRRA